MADRAILHVDMDAFFAAVEVLDDPSLRGKPVIVGGTPEGRGVVAAASYEARRFGVHSAMSAARAVKLCPTGVFLRGRHERYGEVSARIFALCRQFTPLVEPLSIDEAFLDVTGSVRLFGPAPEIGRALKNRIKEEIGLIASVGVAPNKFLAKLASDLDKPDGFFVFTRRDCRRILAELPVDRLWGVGKITHRKLRRLGIEKVADLLAHPVEELQAELGNLAEHLLELAVGHDERPVVPTQPAKSIGHEVTFSEDIGEGDRLREILDGLADKVGRRLRGAGQLARTVNLKARYGDFTTVTRAETMTEPTCSSIVIRDTARGLLARRLGRRGRPLRLIGVSVSNLVEPDHGPVELFPVTAPAPEDTLDRVMDRVHRKYGPVLKRGLNKRRSE